MTTYAILSNGQGNSYGGGNGEVVAVVEAANRQQAIEAAISEGVEFYNGQRGEAVPRSRWTAQQARDASELSVLVSCSCGRETETWTAAARTGHCTHEGRS